MTFDLGKRSSNMFLNHKIFSKCNFKLFHIARAISISASKTDTIQQDKLVLKPLTYIRTTIHQPKYSGTIELYQVLNHWFKLPENKRETVLEAMYTHHSTAILMDDSVDDPPCRYSMVPTHTIYGVPLSINSSYFGIYKTLENMANLDPRAIQFYMDAGQQYCRGQGIEIYWRENLICPSEDDYIAMVKQKSSSFLILAYNLHQLNSVYEVNCLKLAEITGVYHQIVDDYMDLLTSENSDMRSFCTDISEGKFTLPIIHGLKHTDSPDEIMNILKQRTDDAQLKKMCLSLLDRAGSLDYTKDMLYKLEKDVHDEIKNIGGNPEMLKILEKISVWKQVNYHIK